MTIYIIPVSILKKKLFLISKITMLNFEFRDGNEGERHETERLLNNFS